MCSVNVLTALMLPAIYLWYRNANPGMLKSFIKEWKISDYDSYYSNKNQTHKPGKRIISKLFPT